MNDDTHRTSSMGAAILENIHVTRSKDSTLFREIPRFVLTERPLAWDFAKFRAKCYGRTQPYCVTVVVLLELVLSIKLFANLKSIHAVTFV